MTDQSENTASQPETSGLSNLLTHVGRNKLKIATGVIVSIFALVIPFVLASSGKGDSFVVNFGYWIVMAAFACFLVYATRLAVRGNALMNWIRSHRWAVVIALALTSYLWVNDWHGFKILFDEHVIGGVAMNMHFDQKAGIDDTVHFINETPIGYGMHADKRPLFFQFLVSLAHKVLGYRPENSIYLNGFLTFLCLTCLYATVSRLTNRFYGIISMALLAGLPLLAENTTSGGFDIANLLLISVLLLVAILFVEKPDRLGLNAIVATAVLLANTRYESVIYVLVPCALLIWLWLRADEPKLSWFAVLAPFFLVLPITINRISVMEGGDLHMAQGQLFGFDHVAYNLKHACVFLFSPTKMGTNSLLLSALGAIATISLFVVAITRFRQRDKLPRTFVPLIATAGVILITVYIALLWGWGEWTDPLASRFALPLHLIWAVLIPIFFFYLLHYRKPPMVYTVLVLVFLFGVNYPIRGMNRDQRKFLPAKECAWVVDYLKEHKLTENNLFIAFGSYGLHDYRIAAISPSVANQSPLKVFRTSQYGIYQQVYAIQEIRSGYLRAKEEDVWYAPLSPDFILETVAEERFSTDQSIRISRVVGVKGEDAEPLLELPTDPIEYRRFIISALPR